MPKNIEKKVFPGDDLAVIEEYNDGKGTYQQDGLVRSEEIGETKLNVDRRAIEVKKATRELNLPEAGAVVIAETGSVTRRDARVDITRLNGKACHPTWTGLIHQNDVSREFGRDLEAAMRTGDIIKARIINTSNTIIQLAMDSPEFGVIYAYCSNCGGILNSEKGQLVCPSCKRVERRQIARTYGKEDIT